MEDVVGQALFKMVETRLSAEPLNWFQSQMQALSKDAEMVDFSTKFASATRRFGRELVLPDDQEKKTLVDANIPLVLAASPLDQLARTAMLLKAFQIIPENDHMEWVQNLYYRGDNLEKEAVLRSLYFLPAPKRFLSISFDATRNHVQTVFESIACENPYPSSFFPELNFNQMVLKTLFTGVELDRIYGWQQRNNPELVRMAGEYALERKAADRPVPEDIQRIIDHARS